jgi:hypothetical protein
MQFHIFVGREAYDWGGLGHHFGDNEVAYERGFWEYKGSLPGARISRHVLDVGISEGIDLGGLERLP